jgi:hypothetical protein
VVAEAIGTALPVERACASACRRAVSAAEPDEDAADLLADAADVADEAADEAGLADDAACAVPSVPTESANAAMPALTARDFGRDRLEGANIRG